MIDVLFFSILAIFVILRLKKILGNEQIEESTKKIDKNQSISRLQKYSKIIKIGTKETKNFTKKQEIYSNVDLQQQYSYDEISMKKKRQFDHDAVRAEILSINPGEKEEIIDSVIYLCKKYPFFSYKTLVSGFQMINEQVIKSYSSQSQQDLLIGLNADIFDKFCKAIEENESNDIIEKIEILRFEELAIREIKTKHKNTEVVFYLSTKQLQYKISKSDGSLVDGSKSFPVSRQEEWTISDSGDCLTWRVTNIKLLGCF